MTKLKYFIPPILILLYKKIFSQKQKTGMWSGDYSSWEDANANCLGYDAADILKKCKNALLKVKNGEAAYERDSVLFDKIQYSWGLLAGLQKVAVENNNSLCVLDFGGSLGSTYYQNKEFLSSLKSIEWCIVEQAHFVECGKQNFENEQLKFYNTIEECLQKHKPNVLLLSSVLQYLENPSQWIEEFNDLEIEYIIIDRTAFIAAEKDILTIQNVPESIYKASYPAWFFNQEKLIKKFTNFAVVAEIDTSFTGDALIHNKKAKWTGMILKKKA